VNVLEKITQDQLRTDIPDFQVGDTVRVGNKVVEGNRSRTQMFEGTVIARKGSGVSETFTVRKISFGVGVERTWPVHSPKITEITVVKKGKVRRAKLNFLKDYVGKTVEMDFALCNWNSKSPYKGAVLAIDADGEVIVNDCNFQ